MEMVSLSCYDVLTFIDDVQIVFLSSQTVPTSWCRTCGATDHTASLWALWVNTLGNTSKSNSIKCYPVRSHQRSIVENIYIYNVSMHNATVRILSAV